MPQLSTVNVEKQRRSRRGTRKPRRDTTKMEVSRFAGDAYDLGSRAWAGVKALKNLINIEVKFFDQLLSLTPTPSSGCQYMSGIGQGTSQGQRLGNSMKLQNIMINYVVTKHASATFTQVRLILFRDNMNLGTTPVSTLILENTAAATLAITPYAFTSDVATQRFGIVADHTFALDVSHPQEIVKFNAAHGGHIKYSGTGSAASDGNQGSLYLLELSNEATNTPTVSVYERLLYTDD